MASLAPFTGNLGIKNAAHLLRRITFGANRQQIDNFAGMTAAQALDDLFQDTPIPEPPIDPLTGETWLNPAPVQDVNSEEFLLVRYYLSWHLEQMRTSGMSAKERIVYFLHTQIILFKFIALYLSIQKICFLFIKLFNKSSSLFILCISY